MDSHDSACTNLDLAIPLSVPLPTRFYLNIRSASGTPTTTSWIRNSMQRFAVHTNFLQVQDSSAQSCFYEVMKTCWMCKILRF
jgi:hypothetical protein